MCCPFPVLVVQLSPHFPRRLCTNELMQLHSESKAQRLLCTLIAKYFVPNKWWINGITCLFCDLLDLCMGFNIC